MAKAPDPRAIRAKIKENLEAARETIARTHAVLDQARQLLQELNESRQLRRASAERKAEQHLRPHSDQPPRSTAQAADSPPAPQPAGEPSPLPKETE